MKPEENRDIPIHRKKGILLKLSSFEVLADFRRGLFYSYLSIYLRFFLGLSVTETTLFATLPMILNVVFQTFVWGVVSDKYQKRRTLIILGEITAAVTTFMVWYLHTLPQSKYMAGYVIIIGLSVVEIFWSMSNVAWSALLSDLYPAYERTAVQGKLSSIGSLGRMVGVWAGGLAYDGIARYYEGWGFHEGLLFFISSAVMLISTIPMIFVPEGGVATEHKVDKVKDTNKIFGHNYSKQLIVFLLAMLLINFGRNSVALTKSQYLSLKEGFSLSSRTLSYVVNTQSFAVLIVGFLMGSLVRTMGDKNLIFVGSTLACFDLLGFAVSKTLGLIFVSSFLAGASHVIVLSSSYTYASRLIPPAHRGKQFALFNATFYLGWGAGGTLVAGPLVDTLIKQGKSAVLAYKVSFLAGLVMVVGGIVLLANLSKMERQPQKPTTT